MAPNFCPSCGYDLKNMKPAKVQATTRRVIQEEVDDKDSTDVMDISSIDMSKIKISIQVPNANSVKLGDVIANAKATGPTQESIGPRPTEPSADGKEAIQRVMRECSSSKNNSKEMAAPTAEEN